MNFGTAVMVIVALAVGWVIQMSLAYRQANVFQRQVRSLRARGPTATGRSGSRLRGIVYCTIAVDDDGRVAGAELLRGYTVFARPRTFPELVGCPLGDLVARDSSITDRATADAARTLLAHTSNTKEDATSRSDPEVIDGRTG